MKEMAAMQPGMSFYSELPDSYNLIVNTEHPIIKKIKEGADSKVLDSMEEMAKSIEEKNSAIQALRDTVKDKGADVKLSDEDQGKVTNLENEVTHLRKEENRIVSDYAASQPLVKQVIDLALLANGLLKGEALNAFIRRSVNLL